jgi:hypothetical protein
MIETWKGNAGVGSWNCPTGAAQPLGQLVSHFVEVCWIKFVSSKFSCISTFCGDFDLFSPCPIIFFYFLFFKKGFS